ncbi:MAG: DUF732 domain-containing protein [Actinomycetota bacterium]|nr:DUF732 domain-containing protein [Actinomycetota bacterium]
MIGKLVASAMAILLASGLVAAPVRADQYDFISDLDSNGVYYRDIVGMMELGKKTCYNLRTGTPLGGILSYLVQREGFAGYEASTIVSAAATNMCPDTIPFIEAQLKAPPAPLEPVGAY